LIQEPKDSNSCKNLEMKNQHPLKKSPKSKTDDFMF
jgi:hypothetical protein